jgi:hypothetical protein
MSSEELYKEHYFHELSRKDSLNGSLSFPVGLVTLLAGTVSLMAKRVDFSASKIDLVFLGILILCSLCLVIACFYLIRSYWGHRYFCMPYSSDLMDYQQALKEYHSALGNDIAVSEKLADDDLYKYIYQEYAKNGKLNTIANDTKSARLFKANAFIISAIVMALAAGPLYVYKTTQTVETPYKVELINHRSPNMTEPTTNQTTQQPAQQQPAPAPVKPTAPPSREIKEHVDPTKIDHLNR